MKILVPISNVPDTTAKVNFTNNDTEFNNTGVTFIINPYDEWYALGCALNLKEAGKADKITLIHVGKAEADATIRKGFALGADDGVRIDSEAMDALMVAQNIVNYAKNNAYDLILVGKETISHNGTSVGAMIAGILDYPFIAAANKLTIEGTTATISYEVDGGTQSATCSLPLVVSCAKGMAEQRIPNMKGIMASRTKPLEVVNSSQLTSFTKPVKFTVTPGRSTCKMIDENNLDELVQLLHTQAKVI